MSVLLALTISVSCSDTHESNPQSVLPVTAEELYRSFCIIPEGLTSLQLENWAKNQKLRWDKEFSGRPVRWSGRISDVTKDGVNLNVTVSDSKTVFEIPIVVVFDKKTNIAELQKGQTITFEAKLGVFNPYGMQLSRILEGNKGIFVFILYDGVLVQ